mmetsp:Transcript_49506/g.107235  ORF Transcript_49506/g.107235 Transcript_49506/m.107235 type:complete len:120 (-) Transcript_49506:665-1024(-)
MSCLSIYLLSSRISAPLNALLFCSPPYFPPHLPQPLQPFPIPPILVFFLRCGVRRSRSTPPPHSNFTLFCLAPLSCRFARRSAWLTSQRTCGPSSECAQVRTFERLSHWVASVCMTPNG